MHMYLEIIGAVTLMGDDFQAWPVAVPQGPH